MSARKLAMASLVLAFSVSPANAQKMYWADFGGIVRANLDGSEIEVVVKGLFGVLGIAVDIPGGKIYWTNSAHKIRRANLDGSHVQDLITGGLDDPWGIALDLGAGKMYWANRLAGKIQRANLDGSAIQDVVTTEAGPQGIALDLEGGKVYWTLPFAASGKIRRANLDGSNVEDLVVISERQIVPVRIALDVPAGKMYWTLADIVFLERPGKIQRANLDGSGVEDLIATKPFTNPRGIALDIRAEKLYWTDPQVGKIQRANLDGSGVEDLVVGFPEPADIVLDLSRNEIPTVSEWGLVVMGLLVLTVGIVVLGRRRSRVSRWKSA